MLCYRVFFGQKTNDNKTAPSFTDLCLKLVATYCSRLRELSVSDCPRVSDGGLVELARLGPSLRYLAAAKCSTTGITDTGVSTVVRHCYKLR